MGKTYSDQSSMGNIDLTLALGSRFRHSDTEVLVGGQVGLMVNGLEGTVVQDLAQDILCSVAWCIYTRGKANHNSDLGGAAQGVLHIWLV